MAGQEKKQGMMKGVVACSICLDLVLDIGHRSTAKLKCGHSFHLDCIGSAFNVKGIMQCPNCRDIEDGNWLYANGCASQEEIPFEDIVYDDDYDLYGVSELIFSNEEHDPANWCPFQGSYPQFSVSFEEVEPSPSGYPEVVVNVLYGDVLSNCPFSTSSVSRPSTHQIGYDSVIGAMRYTQNESVGAEAAGSQAFSVGDNRIWPHPLLPVPAAAVMDDSRHSRLLPIDDRRPPYRILTDIRVHQRSVDASSAYSIWGEPYRQSPVQTNTNRTIPMVSSRNGLGVNTRRTRNRGPSVMGRAVPTNGSHVPFNWGMLNSGSQELPMPTVPPETSWQGDQGIPWRRDGFSPYPWVLTDTDSHRWTSAGPSSSHNNYYRMQDLGNSQMHNASAFQGYPSVFQHDARDINSMHSHSLRHPR